VVHVWIGHMDANLDVAKRYGVPINKGVPRWPFWGRTGSCSTRNRRESLKTCATWSQLGDRVPGNVEELKAAGPASEPGQAAPGPGDVSARGPEARSRSRRARRETGVALVRGGGGARAPDAAERAGPRLLNIAQSTAYSAIVALFPALIRGAARGDRAACRTRPRCASSLRSSSTACCRPASAALLDAAFENAPKHTHSLRALVSAGVVSFAGASNVIATLMEGLRRARARAPRWLGILATAEAFMRAGATVADTADHREPAGSLGHAVTAGWWQASAGDARADLRSDAAAALGAWRWAQAWTDCAAVSSGRAEGANRSFRPEARG